MEHRNNKKNKGTNLTLTFRKKNENKRVFTLDFISGEMMYFHFVQYSITTPPENVRKP